eukprot:TRINITY_DN8608_c0_g1_i4.p1 TRINITY_DN8608_c0_g1~~TRINITY_DN8608_c0_g1_i4.p1  ORF type:complete len:104 (+),score=4.19 TRINITY_DN8608_c0_g1_i4:262-573(+)
MSVRYVLEPFQSQNVPSQFCRARMYSIRLASMHLSDTALKNTTAVPCVVVPTRRLHFTRPSNIPENTTPHANPLPYKDGIRLLFEFSLSMNRLSTGVMLPLWL